MKKTIICVGCSWTYGHGLPSNETYPAHLQNYLKDYTVINAGHCGADINYAIFSAVRLIEEYNPSLVIFQLTSFDRITIGTDGYKNFISDVFYDGKEDKIYFEDEHDVYKRVIGIADNIKTKITHGSYMATDNDLGSELKDTTIKNLDLNQYRNFINSLVENIMHSNYMHQRIFNDLFLFQKYLELKNINLQYFYWLHYKGKFKDSYNSKLFNSNKLIEIPVVQWFKENYPTKNFYLDNGYHLSSCGNQILIREYLMPYLEKLI